MIEQVVQSFYITEALGITHGTYISYDCFGSDLVGIYHAVQVQSGDHIREADPRDLGHDLGFGDLLGVQRQHDVLLIDAREGNECICVEDTFLLQDLLVGAVRMYDDGFGKQDREFFATCLTPLDDLDLYTHIGELKCQIICRASAADYHRISYGMRSYAYIIHELADTTAGTQYRYDIACLHTEGTGRDDYLSVSLDRTDQDGFGVLIIEIHDRFAV